MNKKAQTPVLWAIIELILVIFAGFAMFSLVGNAGDNDLPVINYAAKDLAFTRLAMDIFAGANAWYNFVVPDANLDDTFFLNDNVLKVGPVNGRYAYDSHNLEISRVETKTAIIQSAGGMISIEEDTPGGRLEVPCDYKSNIPEKIAFKEIENSPQSEAIVNLIRANFKTLEVKVEDAEAVVIVSSSEPSEQYIVQYNEGARTIACRVLNELLPDDLTQVKSGIIKFDGRYDDGHESLSNPKPTILVKIQSSVDHTKVARKIHEALK
jgi:hypothetical protein